MKKNIIKVKFYFLIVQLIQIHFIFAQQPLINKKETGLHQLIPTIKQIKNLKGGLQFIVMGDWGRHGEENQRKVALSMASAAIALDIDFYVITGDNFYPKGVASVNDPSWQSSFENIYNQHPHYLDWYVVLGNHDYKTNPEAQIEYSRISARWNMPERYYSITKKISDNSSIDFFFIDTSPFQKDYYSDEEYSLKVKLVDTARQKLWLEEQFKKSTATWKFVVGHHPLYSAGKRKGKTQDMENSFAPLFEKYKIDAYFCGHEHHLELDKPEGYHFIECISGAGSETTAVSNAPYAKFVAKELGFIGVSVNDKELLIQYINEKGQIIYTSGILK